MKKKYPLKSTRKQLFSANIKADGLLRNKLKVSQLNKLGQIQQDAIKGKDTYSKYSKNGKFTQQRKKFHKTIINKTFSNKKTIDKKDPDLYVLAGIATSGKTSVMKKRIHEPTVHLDNDNFKAELSTRDKSPLKKYKLAHAGQLHREGKHLLKKGIDKSIKESRDVTLDITFSDYKKNKQVIERYKKAGYDIHLLGTQKYTHLAVVHNVNRFLHGDEGRFVPSTVITNAGDRINENTLRARKITDSHIIVDTSDWNNKKVVSEGGSIETNYRDP